MLRKVDSGVNHVYQSVLLANGVPDCEWSLEQLRWLFAGPVKSYCTRSERVFASFLEDTGIVDPDKSVKLCLHGDEDYFPNPEKILNPSQPGGEVVAGEPALAVQGSASQEDF